MLHLLRRFCPCKDVERDSLIPSEIQLKISVQKMPHAQYMADILLPVLLSHMYALLRNIFLLITVWSREQRQWRETNVML